jgi:hypothetical protein
VDGNEDCIIRLTVKRQMLSVRGRSDSSTNAQAALDQRKYLLSAQACPLGNSQLGVVSETRKADTLGYSAPQNKFVPNRLAAGCAGRTNGTCP